MEILTDDFGTIEFDDHTPEAAAVITAHLGETQFLTFDDVWSANRDGHLADIYHDLNSVPGGRDMAWSIWSLLEEGPR